MATEDIEEPQAGKVSGGRVSLFIRLTNVILQPRAKVVNTHKKVASNQLVMVLE
jgi:hypothetical protein